MKIPYDTVVGVDFANLECEALAKTEMIALIG